MRRAGEDDGAGQERRRAAKELDEPWHVEDHVVGVPVLHHLAIERHLDAQGVGVGDFVGGDQHRAKRSERVERLAAAPLAAAVLAPL